MRLVEPDVAGETERVVLFFSSVEAGAVGGRDYAENHFQRKCFLMLTRFLRRPFS